MSRSLAMLCLIAAMTMTGANVPFGKAIVSELPVGSFLLVRFALATALLAVIVPFEPGPRLVSLGHRHWLGLGVLALLGSVLFTAFLLLGLQRTSAVDAGIIMATLPAVVVGLGLLLGERPTGGELAMIALAVAGVALIEVTAAGAVATAGEGRLAGNALIALAVLCEASFVIVSRAMSRAVRPVRLSYGVALASLVMCLPLLALPAARFDPFQLSASVWLLVGWYSLTASVLATVLWYLGAQHLPAWAAGLATAALPVAALAVATTWLGETANWPQLAGAALVIGAIMAGTLANRKNTRVPSANPDPP